MPQLHTLFACAHSHLRAPELHHHAFPLPGDTPQYAPDRAIDITHITLDLRLDFEQRSISGVATIAARVIAPEVSSVTLDAVDLDVAEATLRVGDATTPLTYDSDDRQLRLTLGRTLERGTELQLTIRYSAQPQRGVYFIHPDAGYPDKQVHAWTQSQDIDARAWFPCHTLPDDKATTEVIATVPSGMCALSNGELIARRDNGDGTATFHWREHVPHPAYLVTLVAGPFVELKDEWDGLPVTYYVLPGRETDAERALRRTPEMIKLFSEKLGVRYPYEKYAQVVVSDFIFGGMENTSATTLTDLFLPDERVMPDWTSEGLVAHELAHQWFGDLVTCREWGHGWLNEGFATYFDSIWTEHIDGEDAYRYKRFEDAQRYFAEDTQRYRRPIVTRTYQRPIDVFDMHLYPKGGWVLHMLRAQLGDDAWWRALNHYLTKHRAGTVLTSDLQRAIQEATGRNFDKLFDQYVFTGGHPEFDVTYDWDDQQQAAKLTVKQTQQLDDLTPLFDLPVTIRFETATSIHDYPVRVHDAEHTFTFTLDGKPRLVRFDPDGDILKTLSFKRPLALLTEQLTRDSTVWGRIEAAHELGKQATRRAVAALGAALQQEPFWGVAVQIAKALGDAHACAAKDALLQALDHENSRVRRAVVEALGNFKGDAAVADAVWQRFADGDPSYYVEAEAAKTVGRLKAASAFERLITALERPSWNDVIRMEALVGLGELQDERAAPILKEWSGYGKPLWARMGAITALGKLAEADLHKAEIIEQLGDLLGDSALRVREFAITALAKIGDQRALPALERAARRDLDGRIVRRAREAIRTIQAGASKEAALTMLRNDLDALKAENRTLRDRLEALEQRMDES